MRKRGLTYEVRAFLFLKGLSNMLETWTLGTNLGFLQIITGSVGF